MRRPLVPALLVVLSLVLAASAAAGEPCPSSSRPCDEPGLPGAAAVRPQAVPPSPPALGAPAPAPLGEGAPSLLGALARLFGALLVLALVMAACVIGYRRLVQRAGTPSGVLAWATGWTDETGADAVRVASRRYLGGRESIAVVHAGGERFLVGITGAHVSLLARLEAPAPASEPVLDFTEALARATGPRPPLAEAPVTPVTSVTPELALRAAVERSRERLGRLAHLSLVPRDRRG